MTDAYAAGDEWAVGNAYSIMSGLGKTLTDADLARLERLSESGYPWAFGVLASQRMPRLSDDQGANLSPQEQTKALVEAHEIALKGVLRGDNIAVLAANRIGEELYKKSQGLVELAEVLSTPDPMAFVSSHPKEMESAHFAWRTMTIPALADVDDGTLRLMKSAAIACSGGVPSRWKELCEVRAVADHYVCMRPFSTYLDEGVWESSSAYRTCRLLRLHVQASALYY